MQVEECPIWGQLRCGQHPRHPLSQLPNPMYPTRWQCKNPTKKFPKCYQKIRRRPIDLKPPDFDVSSAFRCTGPTLRFKRALNLCQHIYCWPRAAQKNPNSRLEGPRQSSNVWCEFYRRAASMYGFYSIINSARMPNATIRSHVASPCCHPIRARRMLQHRLAVAHAAPPPVLGMN